MKKELTIKDSIKDLAPVTNKMDLIIKECLPITQAKAQGICEALILAKGLSQLRDIFYEDKNIIATIESMKDTKLGFITDRSAAAIKKNQGYGKKLVSYTYHEIAECCIEALMKGYRLTDNEFNIIAGNFYAAKNGKYRKIIETDGLTNLAFANSMPIFKTETRIVNKIPTQVQYAEIQCYASWKMNGKTQYLGYNPRNPDSKDILIFKIKANEYMGDDGVIGKALSKLFTRVLMRLSGKLIEESTDLDIPEIKVVNPETDTESLTDKIKNASKESETKLDTKTKDVKQNRQSDIEKTPAKDAAKVVTKLSIKEEFEQIITLFEVSDISQSEISAYFGVDVAELESKSGIADLKPIIEKIKTEIMKPIEFKQEAAKRYEMWLKES